MRSIIRLGTFLAVVATTAFAATWSGQLVDATCASQQKTAACTPTGSTTAFAIKTAGKMLKLDDAGNAKAVDALKARENSANRTKDPNAPMTATVEGTLSGDVIQVQSIDIQ